MDYITPIKQQLEIEMHNICALFITIGTASESPRYFNFGGINRENNTIKICSTQKNLFFIINSPYPVNYIEVEEFWKQFKAFRTEFLEANYPTIKTY